MASVLVASLVMPAVESLLVADATLAALVAAAPTAYNVGGQPGIYQAAIQGAARPFVVITPGGERPFNTMGDVSDAKWGGAVSIDVKAVCDGTTAAGLAIVSRVKALLDGQTLTLSGFPSAICEWDALHPAYAELVGGQPVWHVPATFTVTAHQGTP